jgi:hypothetical protein
MIFGAVILRVLGYNPPSAGGFCLSNYQRLMPVETIVLCRTTQSPECWKRIEIFRTNTRSKERVKSNSNNPFQDIVSLSGITCPIDTDCHFIVCNGRIGRDGQILPTKKWTQQEPVHRPSNKALYSNVQNERTIFICVIMNSSTERPTNYQMKRTETLVLELCRRLGIPSRSVRYPEDWWCPTG